MVLFHRFYSRQSFARHDRWLVATTCAFLGFKVEEMHQKARHVIHASWEAYYRGSASRARLDDMGAEFAMLRQQLLDTERCVLYTLQFDIAIDMPYNAIKDTIRAWKEEGLFGSAWPRGASGAQAPPEILALNFSATNIAFECVSNTTLCLTYSPTEIAIASLKLALDLTYSLKGRTSPVGWPALSRLIDAQTLWSVVAGFEQGLEEAGGSERGVMRATRGATSEDDVHRIATSMGPSTALASHTAASTTGADSSAGIGVGVGVGSSPYTPSRDAAATPMLPPVHLAAVAAWPQPSPSPVQMQVDANAMDHDASALQLQLPTLQLPPADE
jgi:hypothetical protein